MESKLKVGVGLAGTLVLMVAALWLWQAADELAMQWSRRAVGLWASRSLALALGSAGQVVLLTLVIGQVYRRDGVGDSLRLGAALVCAISLVSAVALGLAGR
jgi:hypothetical protein